MRKGMLRALWLVLVVLSFGPAFGQINSYSDGSDGVFAPSANIEIDLGEAISHPGTKWTTPGAGKGVYDAEKWAVVFKFSSVNIPANVTVTFKNHPTGAPVVWLIQGDLTLAGKIELNGKGTRRDGSLAEGGPGGFRGGSEQIGNQRSSAGLGPGGAFHDSSDNDHGHGSYAEKGSNKSGPVYGNAQVLPLIGGSGGRGNYTGAGYGWFGGGGGGGAILMVVGQRYNQVASSRVSARGGSSLGGYGSGGAVRIIADSIEGQPGTAIDCGVSGGGGIGRIRLEANRFAKSWDTLPEASEALLGGPEPQIWPDPNSHPRVAVTKVGEKFVPLDPKAQLGFGATDVDLVSATPVMVLIETYNIPVDGTWNVQLRLVPRTGIDTYFNATLVSGNQTAAVWKVDNVSFEKDKGTAVLARAYLK